MVGSMGRVGAAGDNAAMEGFFSLLQKNVLDRRRWDTREQLRIAIVTWIEPITAVVVKPEVRLQPWEDFSGQVDRIVSIGAFEHFGFNKYDDYFKNTFDWLPDDGVQLLHTITIPEDEEIKAKKLPLTMSRVRFIKFIMDEIYPGGRLPLASMVTDHAIKAGYKVTREQHLQPHYVKTLDTWARNLEAKQDEAIEVTSEEITRGS
jgi:cyclopropane-fatty-acyl-phospholipid synthase